jgi:hypothetical protein
MLRPGVLRVPDLRLDGEFFTQHLSTSPVSRHSRASH